MKSVLQDWVMQLPLREQGVILTGVRNCDVSPKHLATIVERNGCSTGESTPDRQLTAFLRWCCLNPADPREVDVPGAWFQSKPPCDWKPSMFGHFPQHWYSHIMHGFQVVAYRHPHDTIRHQAYTVYKRLVDNMHLETEHFSNYVERLSEDRIAKGTVVS